MNAIDRLLVNYTRQVRLPWSTNVAGKQRVWFAVYPPADERRVRARLPEFDAATLEAKHGWTTVDLTRLLPEFLAAHKHREKIFKEPQLLKAASQLEARAAELVRAACAREEADANCVVAITGLASMFDFMRVSSLVEKVEDAALGRLLVFFPGEYTGNVYRFMDARDGFNYMAVPITSTESFLIP
jgi:bacteriophage exclusion system BrxB-like protein